MKTKYSNFIFNLLLFLIYITTISNCTKSNKTNSKNDYFIASDYQCYLKKIVISLSVDDRSLEEHNNLLLSLPEYTKVLLLIPKDNIASIQNELKSKSYNYKIELVPFNTIYKDNIHYYFIFPEKKNCSILFLKKVWHFLMGLLGCRISL